MAKKDQEERIICSAIWYEDGKEHVHMPVPTGFVISGYRHHNCISTAKIMWEMAGKDLNNFRELFQEKVQGFLTSKGRFVDRWQAMAIAYNAGQIDTKRAYTMSPEWTAEKDEAFDYENFPKGEPKRFYQKDETPFNKLFSEDLY